MSIGSAKPEISDIQYALILFADIIDSSKYSAVLGIKNYAQQLLELQETFNALGAMYFPQKDPVFSHAYVKARGDEGIIFYVDADSEAEDLIYKGVQFAFELKARIEMLSTLGNHNDPVPKRMKIGVGIHFGQVALISKIGQNEQGENISLISGIEGFAINYAKRIESCSRDGRYSKIFLSKEAASLLEDCPIVFEKHIAPIKGIETSKEVYEVRSAFLERMPYDPEWSESEKFIETYTSESSEHDLLNEPWLKGLIISVLDSRLKSAHDIKIKADYSKRLSEIAWQKPTEDDPILLFWRAKECGAEGKHTQRLTYLKRIAESFPYFVHARKQLVAACYEITKKTKERSEKIYARDVADEFLKRFPEYLTDQEKESFKGILKKITKRK